MLIDLVGQLILVDLCLGKMSTLSDFLDGLIEVHGGLSQLCTYCSSSALPTTIEIPDDNTISSNGVLC